MNYYEKYKNFRKNFKNDSPFQDIETDFCYSFDIHLQSANILFDNGLYYQAYILYHLAAECFMKYIYVLYGESIFFKDQSASLELLKFLIDKNDKKIVQLLNAKQFSHDLPRLQNFLKMVFPELSISLWFQAFTNSFKYKIDYSPLRYQKPNYDEDKIKEDSKKCRDSLVGFIDGIYLIMETKNDFH